MQVNALEKIATYRREGVLRSELSKTLGMDAKAFHYVATVSYLSRHIWSLWRLGFWTLMPYWEHEQCKAEHRARRAPNDLAQVTWKCSVPTAEDSLQFHASSE